MFDDFQPFIIVLWWKSNQYHERIRKMKLQADDKIPENDEFVLMLASALP